MKKIILLLCFVLCFSLIVGQGLELGVDDKNTILKEFREGKISVNSIAILSQYGSDGILGEDQEEFVSAITELDSGNQKEFWDSFWELEKGERSDFFNSFGSEQKSKLLNTFSNQFTHKDRDTPVLNFTLKGDVVVGFSETKNKGQKYVTFENKDGTDKKFIYLDFFSIERGNPATANTRYNFIYHADTDTLIKEVGGVRFTVTGGSFIMSREFFYVLDENKKIDKNHILTGMNMVGNIDLDMTEDEYTMSLRSYGEGESRLFSGVDLKNGMRISSIKDSDDVSEVVFSSEGRVKSVENLDMTLLGEGGDRQDFTVENGKYRFSLDVTDLHDSDGKIRKEKIEELMLGGGKKSEYDGLIIFDDDGVNGKPFVLAVTGFGGIDELGRSVVDNFQDKKKGMIGDIFGENVGGGSGSFLASVDKKKLLEIKGKIKDIRLATTGIGEATTGVIDFGMSFLGKKKISARDQIGEGFLKAFGREMTDVDYAMIKNPELLTKIDSAVDHFLGRLDEDPKYFERYAGGDFNLADSDVATNAREDLNSLMGVIGEVDSFYDATDPTVKVNLNYKDGIGSLIIGGNVEVFNGDLKITENLKGVRFGAGVVADGDTFTINSPIDFILTSHDGDWEVGENVWEIRKNSQGQLEPFLVGEKEPSVVVSRLALRHLITKEESFIFAGKTLDPGSLIITVSEDTKQNMDASKDTVGYYSAIASGSYEITLRLDHQIDKNLDSDFLNRELSLKMAESIGEVRVGIGSIRNILDKKVSVGSFEREKELQSILMKSSSKASENQFFTDTVASLVREMPSVTVVQTGVDFVSAGYTSYKDISDKNFNKISDLLGFVDRSFEVAEKKYRSGGLGSNLNVITLVSDSGSLRFRNSLGEIYIVDNEISSYAQRLIPIFTSRKLGDLENRVFSERNYKFPTYSRLYVGKSSED